MNREETLFYMQKLKFYYDWGEELNDMIGENPAATIYDSVYEIERKSLRLLKRSLLWSFLDFIKADRPFLFKHFMERPREREKLEAFWEKAYTLVTEKEEKSHVTIA